VKVKHRERVRCDVCGRVDEGVELEIGLWIFTIRRHLCESCVSRMFREFRREL